VKDVTWYRVHKGLRSEGFLVSDITAEQVLHSLICETFGPKLNKSGGSIETILNILGMPLRICIVESMSKSQRSQTARSP
jgi:hypothetical protein